MKKIEFVVIVILLLLVYQFAVAQQQYNVDSNIPSLEAAFKRFKTHTLQLIPRTTLPFPTPCPHGTYYYNLALGFQECSSNRVWGGVGTLWYFNTATDILSPNPDSLSLPDIKVTSYENSPTFILELNGANTLSNNDGFIATGKFGTGTSLPTTAEGAGARFLWYPKRAAFRVGSVAGTQWNESSSPSNIGDYSVAMGLSNIAQGDYSFSPGGRQNNVFGDYSAAFDRLNTVQGDYTLMIGENNLITDSPVPASYTGGDYSFIGGLRMNLDQDNDAAGTDNNNVFLWGGAAVAITPIDDHDVFILYSSRMRINSSKTPYTDPVQPPVLANLEVISDAVDNAADIIFIGPDDPDVDANPLTPNPIGSINFYNNKPCPPICVDLTSQIKGQENGDIIISADIGSGIEDRFIFTSDSVSTITADAVIHLRTPNLAGQNFEQPITVTDNVRLIRGYVNADATENALYGDPAQFNVTSGGTGIYTITLTPAFDAGIGPIPLVSIINAAVDRIATVSNITNISFTVNVFDTASVPSLVTSDFVFKVTGRKPGL